MYLIYIVYKQTRLSTKVRQEKQLWYMYMYIMYISKPPNPIVMPMYISVSLITFVQQRVVHYRWHRDFYLAVLYKQKILFFFLSLSLSQSKQNKYIHGKKKKQLCGKAFVVSFKLVEELVRLIDSALFSFYTKIGCVGLLGCSTRWGNQMSAVYSKAKVFVTMQRSDN